MDKQETIEWIKQRLQQPLPGVPAQERMAARVIPMPLQVPRDARQSAVLCLLFHKNDSLNVLLIKRMADKGAHSGQVSFPGGRRDPEDTSLQATAFREAHEEIGITPEHIELLGALTPLYIPVSNFMVSPFVGYAPQLPGYKLSEAEVAYVLEVPLHELFAPEKKVVVDVVSPAVPGVIRHVKAYRLADETIIWGATAMMLSELEVLISEEQ